MSHLRQKEVIINILCGPIKPKVTMVNFTSIMFPSELKGSIQYAPNKSRRDNFNSFCLHYNNYTIFFLVSESEVTSRVCGRSRYQHFSHECWHYTSVSGDTVRCYCDSHLCNSASRLTFNVLSFSSLVVAFLFATLH